MADSPAFDCICDLLEQETSLDRLEARGTVRIALKRSGLESRNVTPNQMTVLLERVFPAELAARGINDVDGVLGRARERVAAIEIEASNDSPEAVFQRLGG